MNRMAILVAVLLYASFPVWGQIAHDPNSDLYSDLDRWALRGYIDMLPPVRPYPVQLLGELLGQVSRRGDAEARKRATGLLAELVPDTGAINVGASSTILSLADDPSLEAVFSADGILRPEEWLGASWSMSAHALTRDGGSAGDLPGGTNPYADFVEDNASVGSLSIMQNWTSTVAVGSSNLYFQAGLNRGSFGPFFGNGIVLGSQASRAGHFSLVYRNPAFTFSVLLLELSASDDFGLGRFPNKHLILHSIDFNPFPGFEWGFFESVVWGGRFEFLYMAPFVNYFAAQSLTGFADNSFLGLHAKWLPLPGLQAIGQIYADDWNFNDTVRLRFDTRYKFASEFGFRWSPEKSILALFSMDYTAVMPYMYTHITGDRNSTYRYADDSGDAAYPNHFNYSHAGRNLGVDMEPNSDRLSANADFRINPGLVLGLRAGLSRHGNASEGVSGIADLDHHDGTIFDDGYDDDPDDPKNTFASETRFLTQDFLDTRVSAGFQLSFGLPSPLGLFTASADYLVEYGWNRELVKGKDGAEHYYSLSGSWRW